jgi:predicted DNA-binding protein (UPF0251 family)
MNVARPKKYRCVRCRPDSMYFKPRAIPLTELEEVAVSIDELEALRLADYEGLYHENAAARMEISRQTFGRILSAARRKVAECLIKGKALKIEANGDQYRKIPKKIAGKNWREKEKRL